MKVQQITQAAEVTALENWGTAGQPGTYRCSVKQAEVIHFIKGSGNFTPHGENTIRFAAGDTLFFEANTEGLWNIDETLRKIHVIF